MWGCNIPVSLSIGVENQFPLHCLNANNMVETIEGKRLIDFVKSSREALLN